MNPAQQRQRTQYLDALEQSASLAVQLLDNLPWARAEARRLKGNISAMRLADSGWPCRVFVPGFGLLSVPPFCPIQEMP